MVCLRAVADERDQTAISKKLVTPSSNYFVPSIVGRKLSTRTYRRSVWVSIKQTTDRAKNSMCERLTEVGIDARRRELCMRNEWTRAGGWQRAQIVGTMLDERRRTTKDIPPRAHPPRVAHFRCIGRADQACFDCDAAASTLVRISRGSTAAGVLLCCKYDQGQRESRCPSVI